MSEIQNSKQVEMNKNFSSEEKQVENEKMIFSTRWINLTMMMMMLREKEDLFLDKSFIPCLPTHISTVRERNTYE